MNLRRIAVITTAGAIVAGGAGAAIGATSGDKAETQVLADAAKRLNTTPEKLRDALAAAEDAQLDQAVKDGDLTQAQADAIKARRKQSGHVLGGPGGPHLGGPGGPGPGGRHGGGPGFGHGPGGPDGPKIIEDAAKALGLTTDKLVAQLRAGKSVADVAKAQGKDLADVKSAVRSAAKTRLDKAVKAGDITQKQADDMLAHLDEHLSRFDKAGLGGPGGKHGGKFRGGPPPGGPPTPDDDGATAPGSYAPVPAPAPEDLTTS
jgi:hypothetical protein